MADLTTKERQKLPRKDFALPGRGEGKKGAGSGSFPAGPSGGPVRQPRGGHGRLPPPASEYACPRARQRGRGAIKYGCEGELSTGHGASRHT